jgi:short-subunit dehydrogenase
MTTALVTGATAGLGAEFARQLAGSGADIVLVARDEARLLTTRVALEDRHPVKVEMLSADLSTVDGCDRVAERIASTASPIDILVNNAGIGMYRRFGAAELQRDERMLDLNVRAVLRLTHAAVRAMTGRGSGQIINVSSVSGFVPRAGNVTYSASKAWVTTFSEGLALELAGSGVQVTAVCPGFTHTEFHERASADMSKVPDWMWLDTHDVVAQGLADAGRGKPVSVPSARYKALAGAARYTPRSVVRAVMRRRAV